MSFGSRFATAGVVLALGIGLVGGAARAVAGGEDAAQPVPLVVHEWGTFTTVSGVDGVALDWRPLAGPSDLPTFVYTRSELRRAADRTGLRNQHQCESGKLSKLCRQCGAGTVRMETPVLYFYADQETDVRVKVGFPQGRVTEWYPAARSVEEGIDWGRVRILPDDRPALPREEGESHYYPAREVDAATVRVCEPRAAPTRRRTQHERFLFYRGVGDFDVPVSVRLDGERVHVRNETGHQVSQVIVFENRGGAISYDIHCYLDGEVTMDRPTAEHGLRALEDDLAKILRGQGLFEKEARAMIATWRDSWFEEGLRVLYTVPRAETDRVLPLTLEPAPAKLERVLVGRVEVLTPAMEKDVASILATLPGEGGALRAAAARGLAHYGRFAEPLLGRVAAATKDPVVRRRALLLMGEPSTAGSDESARGR